MPRSKEDIERNIQAARDRHASRFKRQLTNSALASVLEDIISAKAIADIRGQFAGWDSDDLVRAVESLEEKAPAKSSKAPAGAKS